MSNEQEDFSYQCLCTISNWQARQKTEFTAIILMEDVDLGEPTSFLAKFLVAFKENVSKETVASYRSLFESRISAGAEELPTRASGKPVAETISSWSCDMEGHAKKCVEIYFELVNRTTEQLYKVTTPCMDDHQVREEEI